MGRLEKATTAVASRYAFFWFWSFYIKREVCVRTTTCNRNLLGTISYAFYYCHYIIICMLDQKTRNFQADRGCWAVVYNHYHGTYTFKWVRVINRITNHTSFMTLYIYIITVMKKKYSSILFYFSDVCSIN